MRSLTKDNNNMAVFATVVLALAGFLGTGTGVGTGTVPEVAGPGSPRTTYNLDFGWRFSLLPRAGRARDDVHIHDAVDASGSESLHAVHGKQSRPLLLAVCTGANAASFPIDLGDDQCAPLKKGPSSPDVNVCAQVGIIPCAAPRHFYSCGVLEGVRHTTAPRHLCRLWCIGRCVCICIQGRRGACCCRRSSCALCVCVFSVAVALACLHRHTHARESSLRAHPVLPPLPPLSLALTPARSRAVPCVVLNHVCVCACVRVCVCAQACCKEPRCTVWNWCSAGGCKYGKPGDCWIGPDPAFNVSTHCGKDGAPGTRTTRPHVHYATSVLAY